MYLRRHDPVDRSDDNLFIPSKDDKTKNLSSPDAMLRKKFKLSKSLFPTVTTSIEISLAFILIATSNADVSFQILFSAKIKTAI